MSFFFLLKKRGNKYSVRKKECGNNSHGRIHPRAQNFVGVVDIL